METSTESVRKLRLLIHLPVDARIPLLLEQYGQRTSSIVMQVSRWPNGEALSACQSRCARRRRCRCYAAKMPLSYQHENICDAFRTEPPEDTLFVHADMWVNLSLAEADFARGGPVLPGGRGGLLRRSLTNADWRTGLLTQPAALTRSLLARMRDRPPDTCIPIHHTASWGELHEWNWWRGGTWARCQQAASAVNFSQCCCAWSDLVYLPARLYPMFCGHVRSHFGGIHHEVAIPTILRMVASPSEVTLAHCLGGCCADEFIPWHVARRAKCSHKVDLIGSGT